MRTALSRRDNQQGIYDPDELEQFCVENGGPTVFTQFVEMMTPVNDTRQPDSYKRHQERMYAVQVLHTTMYGQSQKCNWLQRDSARFFYFHGLSDIGLRATHKMGPAVGMSNFYFLRQAAKIYVAISYSVVRQETIEISEQRTAFV